MAHQKKRAMKKRWIMIAGPVAVIIMGLALWLWTPRLRIFDPQAARTAAQGYDARIIRDAYGIPHIYGARNGDGAFGLGYALAEDDAQTLFEVIQFSRGERARAIGKDGAITDFLIHALGVEAAITAHYETDISDETKEILTGYAAGINLWCAEERGRCPRDIAPVTPQDIVAGFVSRAPFFYGLDEYLTALFEGLPEAEAGRQARADYLDLPIAGELGSNAAAVAPSRSADGATRLLVNSHQPFTGPVAWYEARVKTDAGWDMIGGNFPGAPIILQGANPDLGWAFTVNRPDLVDYYRLDVDDANNPTAYRFGDGWRPLERGRATFRVKLFGPFSLPVSRPIYRSVHGPVFRTDDGYMAVAFANDGDIRAVEQWRRMNMARTYEDWRAAMNMLAIPSFNVIFATRAGKIGYIHNAALPIRGEGHSGAGIAAGDDPALVWQGTRAFSENPMVIAPASGFVVNANNNPFEASGDGDNPQREDFPDHYGIDNRSTNRGLRIQSLFNADPAITDAALIAYKMDDRYAPQSRLAGVIRGLLADPALADDPELAPALTLLRDWDYSADQNSRGAALAILTGQKLLGFTLGGPGQGPTHDDPAAALRQTIRDLDAGFGRIDPPWGAVNRLQRGDVDMPLDGGPDTLRAIYATGEVREGPLTANFGDSHIMLVEWSGAGEQRIRTIHQFGAATGDATSPHYDDQAPLFARKEWREPAMALDPLLGEATRDYRVGGDGAPVRQ